MQGRHSVPGRVHRRAPGSGPGTWTARRSSSPRCAPRSGACAAGTPGRPPSRRRPCRPRTRRSTSLRRTHGAHSRTAMPHIAPRVSDHLSGPVERLSVWALEVLETQQRSRADTRRTSDSLPQIAPASSACACACVAVNPCGPPLCAGQDCSLPAARLDTPNLSLLLGLRAVATHEIPLTWVPRSMPLQHLRTWPCRCPPPPTPGPGRHAPPPRASHPSS